MPSRTDLMRGWNVIVRLLVPGDANALRPTKNQEMGSHMISERTGTFNMRQE